MGKKISMAVIRRLPRYYRYLADLLRVDIKRISSKELSERMGITASQIRQDLNCFGGFGQQGYGYNVETLYKEIGKILGVERRFTTIIIGAGNMGNALANYENFKKRGFDLIGIFDISPNRVGQYINGIEIMHMDRLEEFMKTHVVDIAILTVPSHATAEVAEKVAELGVKGIWNFSPQDLKLSHNVVIENVHLSDGLAVLGYRIKEMEEQEQKKRINKIRVPRGTLFYCPRSAQITLPFVLRYRYIQRHSALNMIKQISMKISAGIIRASRKAYSNMGRIMKATAASDATPVLMLCFITTVSFIQSNFGK